MANVWCQLPVLEAVLAECDGYAELSLLAALMPTLFEWHMQTATRRTSVPTRWALCAVHCSHLVPHFSADHMAYPTVIEIAKLLSDIEFLWRDILRKAYKGFEPGYTFDAEERVLMWSRALNALREILSIGVTGVTRIDYSSHGMPCDLVRVLSQPELCDSCDREMRTSCYDSDNDVVCAPALAAFHQQCSYCESAGLYLLIGDSEDCHAIKSCTHRRRLMSARVHVTVKHTHECYDICQACSYGDFESCTCLVCACEANVEFPKLQFDTLFEPNLLFVRKHATITWSSRLNLSF